MKANFFMMILTSILVLFACGRDTKDQEAKTDSTGTATTTATVQSTAADATGVSFRGFVVSAFTVSVDGINYKDMEDFYTNEIGRLPDKAKAAGYDASYTVSLDAQIGFKDLYNGMDVYIEASGNTGYLGHTNVQNDGGFAVTLPQDALMDAYNVRANKRINLLLQKGEQQQKICFNFSAVDQSVQLTDQSKPILIDKFVTSMTKYACETSDAGSDGITLPQIVKPASRGKITKGMNKADTLAVLGADRLIIKSNIKWCWFSDDVAAHPNCAMNITSSCQCSVEFDDSGLLSTEDNISADLINVLSFSGN